MFPLEVHIPLKITTDGVINLKITEGGGGEYPIYTSDIEVSPKTIEQVLPTRNKTVLDDITVLEIPYFETSNVHGTTAIIGGNG